MSGEYCTFGGVVLREELESQVQRLECCWKSLGVGFGSGVVPDDVVRVVMWCGSENSALVVGEDLQDGSSAMGRDLLVLSRLAVNSGGSGGRCWGDILPPFPRPDMLGTSAATDIRRLRSWKNPAV